LKAFRIDIFIFIYSWNIKLYKVPIMVNEKKIIW
jgi:hypothetical protein